MGLNEDGYYTLREILGYNCQYNFVLSDRGRGKSYGTKLFLMRQEGTFMCLYRNVSDVDSAVGTWLDTLYENGYEPEEFEWVMKKGSCELLYHGLVKGYFRALTQVNHIKQEKFPDDLNWVWMDEFIPLVYKKLPGVESEGDAIRAIVKTIDHDTAHPRESRGLKPLRVLLYANPFTWNNPILGYFRVIPRGYGIWKVGPGIACEMLEPYAEVREGKQTIDDFLGDEVNKNQKWLEQDAYVLEKWPKGAVIYMSVRIGRNYYGFYRKEGSKKWYVRQNEEHVHYMRDCGIGRRDTYIYGTLDNMGEDEWSFENTGMFKSVKSMTYNGQIWYKDINTKFNWIRDMSSL